MNKNRITFIVFVVLIISSIFFIYGQTSYFQFINLDDLLYVGYDYFYDELSLDDIIYTWNNFRTPYFMPLTYLSLQLDIIIHGIHAGGFHLTNTLLHSLNSLLVFYLLYVMTANKWNSFFVAILFAVHPQHVEAVAWVAERKELLAALFGLLSLYFYTEYVKEKKLFNNRNDSNALRYYLLTILFFIFSLLSKPMWITLPCLLLLLDCWPMERFKYQSITSLIKEKGVFFLISTMFFVVHYITSDNLITATLNFSTYNVTDVSLVPFGQRFENALVVYIIYFWKCFFPFTFTGYYPYPMSPLPLWKIYIAGLSLVSITSGVIFLFKQRPYLLIGWLWFLGTLFPCIGILNTGGEGIFIGDRWTYLPHIGLFTAIVWWISSVVVTKKKFHKKIFVLLSFLIIFSYGYSAYYQTTFWERGVTLWSKSLEVDKSRAFVHYLLGSAYVLEDNVDKAKESYLQAHKINPDEPFYLLKLGNLSEATNQNEETWIFYNKILNTKRKDKVLLNQIGLYALNANKHNEAERFFKQASQLPHVYKHGIHGHYKYEFLPHLYLSYIYLVANNDIEAIRQYEKFLVIFSDDRDKACDYTFNIFKENMNAFYRKYCYGTPLPEIL
tara:strand:+ start:2874 stop:4709 length:1836 start_codon:yes stop_codon:yes gene_type:complete